MVTLHEICFSAINNYFLDEIYKNTTRREFYDLYTFSIFYDSGVEKFKDILNEIMCNSKL